MKRSIFVVEIEQDEDGIWEAEIPMLPGCAVWGYSREETLEAIEDCAQAYLEVKLAYGDPLPPGAEEIGGISAADVVSITV